MKMIPVYLGLCVAALATTAAAFVGGAGISDASDAARAAAVDRHRLLGLSASVLLLVVQCAVFVYFLGTGKAVKVAVEQRGLDPELARRTRRLKGKTFPFATFSALAVVLGAVLSGSAEPATHATAMGVAVALTLVAVPFEIRSIQENSKLMDRTGDALERAESAIEAEGGTLQDPDAAPIAFVLGRGLLVVAGSAWLVFAYRALVMRAQPDPWPWYVLLSLGCALAGLPLVLAGRRKQPDAATG